MSELLQERRTGQAAERHVPVWSVNEWDPLQEVIVGRVARGHMPNWDLIVEATMPAQHHALFRSAPGQPFPEELVVAAEAELDNFCHVLKSRGIVVRRPAVLDYNRPFSTPDWSVAGGMYAAMPRDCLIVLGDQIIEAPMAWRARYFETQAFRPLLREYFERGARWTAAPKPELVDSTYNQAWTAGVDGGAPAVYATTEYEPTFDAADLVRFGDVVYAQRSHVTNAAGIEWLRRHLASEFRVEEVQVHDSQPMHIDASLVPLAPGVILIHPDRIRDLPRALDGWEQIVAPPPAMPDDHPLFMTSRWLSMNVLSLDERTVVVEASELPLAERLAAHGFEPVLLPFRNVNSFGGSFHCVTLDVRRGPPPPSS